MSPYRLSSPVALPAAPPHVSHRLCRSPSLPHPGSVTPLPDPLLLPCSLIFIHFFPFFVLDLRPYSLPLSSSHCRSLPAAPSNLSASPSRLSPNTCFHLSSPRPCPFAVATSRGGGAASSPNQISLQNSDLGAQNRSILDEMDLFHRARLVQLRSHLDKYLMAEDDQEHVCQDHQGASYNARWAVELVEGPHPLVRLKSRHDLYLTASKEPFLLGFAGRKVIQTALTRLDSSVEWEPIRDGFQVMLKTRDGRFLRSNGGLPPWRNSVTHYTPHCSIAPTWILWDVHILDITPTSPSPYPSVALDPPPTCP